MVLPTEEYREHPHEAQVIIDIEIEDRPPSCDRTQSGKKIWAKRSLVGRVAQSNHLSLNPLDALSGAHYSLIALIAKSRVTFEQEFKNSSQIFVRLERTFDPIGH